MTITRVTCHDAGWAFAGYGNNFTLSYCNIYNIDHGLAFGPAGTNSGFSIHDNHIHDYVKWDSTTNALWFSGITSAGVLPGGPATGNSAYNNFIRSGGHRTGAGIFANAQSNFTAINNVILGGNTALSVQGASSLSAAG